MNRIYLELSDEALQSFNDALDNNLPANLLKDWAVATLATSPSLWDRQTQPTAAGWFWVVWNNHHCPTPEWWDSDGWDIPSWQDSNDMVMICRMTNPPAQP